MRSVFVKGIGLGSVVLVVLLIKEAASLFVGNLQFTNAETEVSFWGRENYQPTANAIKRTTRTIDALLSDSSRHPSYLSLQSNILVWLAYWEADQSAQDLLMKQTIAVQIRAIKSRPAHRQSWIKLLEYLSNSNNSGETERWARGQLTDLQLYAQGI